MDDVDYHIDLQVSYYDQDDTGFWASMGNYTVRVGDMHTPLIETIHKALPESLRWGEQDSTGISCYVNDTKGQSIDLRMKPNQIPYIMDTLRRCTKPLLYLCRDSRCDSGVSIGSLLSPDTDTRRPSTVVSRNFTDIGSPPTAMSNDEQILFNDDGEDQESSDSDDVFPYYPTPKDDPESRKSATLPPTTSGRLQTHAQQIGVSQSAQTQPHCRIANTVTRTRKFPWLKMHLFTRAASESDIGGSCGDDRMHISTSMEEIAFRDLVGVSASQLPSPQPPSPQSPSTHPDGRTTRRPGLRQRRNAFKRKSTYDLIPLPLFDLESLQVNAADVYGCNELHIPCENFSTVGELKQAITVELDDQKMSQATIDPSALVLTYTSGGTEYELLDGSQFLDLCDANKTKVEVALVQTSTTVEALRFKLS